MSNAEDIKLYNGDCLEVMDNLIEQGVKVDMILTDPPYNASQENNFNTMKNKDGKIKYGSIDFGEWDKGFDITGWINKATTLLKDGGTILIFNRWRNLNDIANELEQNRCIVKNIVQWIKPNSAPRNRDRLYINNFEFAVWAVKGKGWTFNRQDEKMQFPQFKYPFVSGKEKTIHPTQKPVKLMKDLINIHSNENDLVLDCFMGSGTTGVACKDLNRKFIGIELENIFFNIAENRIKSA